MNVCIPFDVLKDTDVTIGALAPYIWHIFPGKGVEPLILGEIYNILGDNEDTSYFGFLVFRYLLL